MFSLHIYEDFQNNYNLESVLNTLQTSKIPIQIGEFGPRSSTNVIDVMAKTVEKGIGYIGWAWQGDGTSPYGECNSILNVVLMKDDIPGDGENEVNECRIDFRDLKGNFLTNWGDILINDPNYGVAITSKKSSVFYENNHIIQLLLLSGN